MNELTANQLSELVNSLPVDEVFWEYSEFWKSIARSHIRSIWESTKFFLEQVLQHLIDAKVCGALFYELLESIMDEKLDLAYSKLGEVTAVYKDHSATLNHCFQDNVIALQKARRNPLIEEKLREVFSERSKIYEHDISLLMLAMQFEKTPDMNRKVAEEIFDSIWEVSAILESMSLQISCLSDWVDEWTSSGKRTATWETYSSTMMSRRVYALWK